MKVEVETCRSMGVVVTCNSMAILLHVLVVVANCNGMVSVHHYP